MDEVAQKHWEKQEIEVVQDVPTPLIDRCQVTLLLALAHIPRKKTALAPVPVP